MNNERIRAILVPVDFSECSRRAAAVAAQLAAALGARIDLFHVWNAGEDLEELTTWWDTLHPSERSAQSLASVIESARQGNLNELAVELHRLGVEDVGTKLVPGPPVRAIVDAAEGYQLVVMGTHGRSGLAEFFIGSVAERVVRRCPVPVLAVPMSGPPRSKPT